MISATLEVVIAMDGLYFESSPVTCNFSKMAVPSLFQLPDVSRFPKCIMPSNVELDL